MTPLPPLVGSGYYIGFCSKLALRGDPTLPLWGDVVYGWPLTRISKSALLPLKSNLERKILVCICTALWDIYYICTLRGAICYFWEVLGNTFWRVKGKLISKGLFGFFNSPKKRTKNFCPSRLGQNLTFSSSFFGRIEDTKISFRDFLSGM